jgi:excisionase family DNA binding protein
MDSKALTVRKAAEVTGVSKDTVRRWADKGIIPAYRLPSGHRRLDADAVERFAQDLRGGKGREVLA